MAASARVGGHRPRYREETQEEGDGGEVSGGEEELVEQRAVGNSAERGEDQLGAGRVDRADIAVIDLIPGGKLRADRLQLRIIRRMDVRIETSLLDFSLPLVAPEIVSRLQRQHDQTQDDHNRPEDRAFETED